MIDQSKGLASAREIVPGGAAAAAVRIVIPAHNEETRITPAIEDYCAYFGERATVVVVANGCSDDTVGTVRALQARFANLRLIDIPGRVGKGGAIRAGLKGGAEPFVGFVDADHSTQAAEFDRLLRRCVETRAAGVIASRWMSGSRVSPRQPWKRLIASRAFNALVRAMLGLRFRDTQCGAKVFTREAVRGAEASLFLADFAFDIDLLYSISKHGGTVLEEPTVWADKAAGTTVRLASASARMALSVLRLRLEHSPLSRLPFFEFLAADAIVPHYRPPTVLLLAGSEVSPAAARRRMADDVVDRLRADGIVCRQPPVKRSGPGWLGKLTYRMRFLGWYTFGSHRRYDAIVELATDVPFLVPAFSAKRTFVVTDDSVQPLMQTLYRRYRRSVVVDASRDDGTALLRRLRAATTRVAAFEELAGTWVLHVGGSRDVLQTIELR